MPKDFEGYKPLGQVINVIVAEGMGPIVFNYVELTQEELAKLTVVKLKELADALEIEYASSDTKQDLIDKIMGGG